jgi:ATP-dependent helicase/nuclease subunit B
MPQLEFLTQKQPLVFKVAAWLATSISTRPWDFSETAIVLSTSAAGLRLRDQLVGLAAEQSTGVLPPVLTTPLALLDRALIGQNIATRQTRLEAWYRAIKNGGLAAADLLSGFDDPLPAREVLRIAESLMEVCSLLAEGGLTPQSESLFTLLPQDDERWRNVRDLYALYVSELEELSLQDPNEARLVAVEKGILPLNITRVIIANVPDLNPLVRRYFQKLEQLGTKVTVLVDAPDCEEAIFDAWGGPDPEYWGSILLPLTLRQIAVAADPYSEGELAARLSDQGAAICQIDERLAPTLRTAFARRNRAVFDPGGESLASSEVGVLVKSWRQFCSTQLLSDLRLVLECPAFLRALGREGDMPPSSIQSAYDQLRTGTLIDLWSDVVDHFRGQADAKLAPFVRLVESWRDEFRSGAESVQAFIRRVYANVFPVTNSREGRALRAYGEVLRGLATAPRPADARIAGELLDDAVAQARLYDEHPEDAVELNGWLEAAWLPDTALVLAGCAEGVLPSATNGHSFLPEAARQALGLVTNAARLARDAFLLHNLLASRERGAVMCLYGRETTEGEPAKPSRLLFRCPDADLPARVKHLFGPAISLREAVSRQRGWKLDAIRQEPPKTLRVTAFADYLACPLRFYFKHVQRLESVQADAAEMDAREFGTLFHLVVEAFALDEELRESTNAAAIEKFVAEHLDRIIFARHGRRPSLPVRVQQESLRVRLRQFARIQAIEREAGWRIQHAEYRFLRDDTISLAGLPLTASLDRVEVHEGTGQRRILDYKTFARDKTPEMAHLARNSEEPFLPGEEVFWQGKVRYWRNLQLPLYRALSEFRWPGEEPPIVGYFLLPERVEESRIEELALDAETSHAAVQCAEAIAERVGRGIFWPPRAVDYDDYEELFLGDDPAAVFTEESIAFFQGIQEVGA